jgi:hypothetical protein
VHVSGTHHGPDGLSRRPYQNGDDEIKQISKIDPINSMDLCIKST